MKHKLLSQADQQIYNEMTQKENSWGVAVNQAMSRPQAELNDKPGIFEKISLQSSIILSNVAKKSRAESKWKTGRVSQIHIRSANLDRS